MIPLLISGIGLAAAVILYYRHPGRLVLRIVPFLLLFLILSRLSLDIKKTRHPGPAAVLIDVSASFWGQVPAVMRELPGLRFPYSRFFFAESMVSQLPDTTGSFGRFTDITRALAEAQEQNPEAIILISDGNHNFGEAPLSAGIAIRVPVSVFAAGTEGGKNIAITNITYPQIVYAGDSVRIKVEITSGGFSHGAGRVSAKVADRDLRVHETFALSLTRAKNTVELTIPQTMTGMNAITITAAPQPDESSYDDNQCLLNLRTYERAVSVLYLTDHLSFNTRYLLASLSSIDGVDLAAFAQFEAGSFRDLIEQKDTDQIPDPALFDVIALDNVRFGAGARIDLPRLLDRAKGILITGSCEDVTNSLRAVLPLDITGNQIKGKYPVQVVSDFSNLKSGKAYPPFEAINQVIGVKTGAVIIVESNKVPLIAYWKHLNGYVFQINALDLGTWGFSQRALPEATALSLLLQDIIRFLSPVGRENRLVLKSFAKKYPRGEPVALTLESYDRDFNLKGGGDFYAVAGRRKIPFFQTSQGFYEATLVPDDTGNIVVTAYGLMDNDSLQSNACALLISGENAEIRKSVNRILLSSLAEATGGQYHTLDQLAGFTPPKARPETTKRSVNFDHPAVYFLIFAVLAVDWVLRRRQGSL